MKTRAKSSLATALLLTAFLPSCLTMGTWENLSAQPWEKTTVASTEISGERTVRVDPETYTIRLLGTDDLEIRAQYYNQTGAALLLRPDLFEVESASLRGKLTKENGRTIQDTARLTIKGRVIADGLRTMLDADELPVAARAQLDEGTPTLMGIPADLRLLSQKLQGAELHLLVPEFSEEAKLVSMVLLDAQGKAVLPDPSVRTWQSNYRCYPTNRSQLRSHVCYARVVDQGTIKHVRFDAESLYLVGSLDCDRNDRSLAVHNKQWDLVVVDTPEPEAGTLPEFEAKIGCELWRGSVVPKQTPALTQLGLVALTPFTLVADVVYTPVVLVLFAMYF